MKFPKAFGEIEVNRWMSITHQSVTLIIKNANQPEKKRNVFSCNNWLGKSIFQKLFRIWIKGKTTNLPFASFNLFGNSRDEQMFLVSK